jgi:hypothetical protein
MLETRTRLQAAIPANLNANSKLVSFSRCFPTPLVKNIRLATNIWLSTFSSALPIPMAECVADEDEPGKLHFGIWPGIL